MSLFLRTAGCAVLTAICSMVLKKLNDTAGRAVGIAGILVTFLLALDSAGQFFSSLDVSLDFSLLGVYGSRMLKALGIGLTVKVSSDICRGCGEDYAASGIELAGKAEIILLCLPTVKELLSLAAEMMT